MKKLLLIAALAASFAMGQAAEVESIARKSAADITIPSGQVWRQGIGVNGKFYINDRAGDAIHVLGLDAVETGTLAKVDGANWPSITKDEVGNLIVRSDASWPANLTPDVPFFRIFPADGSDPVDLNMPASFFETSENGRMDYFGTALGNVLEDGELYLATQKSTGIFRVVFSGGEVDEDNSMLLPVVGVELAYGTDVVVSSFTGADGSAHHIFCNRGQGKNWDLVLNEEGTALVATAFTLPNRSQAAGGMIGFALGDEDFYAFGLKPGLDASQASSHPDGVMIVRASDPETPLFTDYGTGRSGYNGAAPGLWLSAEIDGNTATIYEYTGGGSVMTFEMTVKADEPAYEDVFILGNVDGAWDPSVGQQMETEDGINYTATLEVVDMDGYNYFSFTKKLAENSGDWDGIAPYRFGAADSNGDFVINEETVNIPIALGMGGQAFKIPVGTYTLKVNLQEMTLIVEGSVTPHVDPVVEPDGLYVLGDVVEQGWDPHYGVKMDTEDETVFTADLEVSDSYEGNGWFGLSTALCPDGHSDPWNAIAPFRFGPVSEGDFVVTDELLGQEISLTLDAYPSFQVPAGSYKLTVDLSTMKAVVTKAGDEPGVYGDVNGDGQVTAADVSAVYNIILGASTEYQDRADVNGDGQVTAADVSVLYNIILGAN